jgi:hypothetical protein
LWDYHSSIQTHIGNTPYDLVYGVNAIMPLELQIPSLRISLRGLINDIVYKEKLLQIEILDEKNINHLEYLQAYPKRVQHIYNNDVIPCSFNKGDLVLYENQYNANVTLGEKGKFSPNW